MTNTEFRLPERWPTAFDTGAAERLLERFRELGPAEARLMDAAAVRAMLFSFGGNSPYLADLVLREPETVLKIAENGPGEAVQDVMADLAGLTPSVPRARLAAALRRAKRIVALATAVADIGDIWRLEEVTAALSGLAEQALSLSAASLLRAAHDAGELQLPYPGEPARSSAFTVLGMGKLGARELNYSSDVDLVLLYDAASPVYSGALEDHSLGTLTTRVARGLVSLMEARDADGYVFRTDLRLRPDPAATPPAVPIAAALTYYESMGQNWERAAMIKARPVAGDLTLGREFLDAIRPFVWRRGLDFAAVADIHAMKQRVDRHRGGVLGDGDDPVRRIAGHNVKLGEGGIREIEFLTQTLELVWGGRDPELREPATLPALRLLARAGHLSRQTAAELAASYRFLRAVEHRLQMVSDRQVHALPEKPAELERFAAFMGYVNSRAFAGDVLRHLAQVRARYADVFERVPTPLSGAAPAPSLDFSGADLDLPETDTALREMGFREPARVINAVRRWQAGHVRALRSARARELMEQVLPALLGALGRQPQPDSAFGRFDAFIAAQPAGVQLLSLFQHNPQLLERVAAILGAPALADHLARYPAALEGLLSGEIEQRPERLMMARLKDARQLEDAIAIIRRVVREQDFSLSAATMECRLDANAAGELRSDLASAALSALLPSVLADFKTRFGRVPGGGMAVVVLGKCGGREMMAGSDLDLMLIYDHPPEVAESRGARHIPVSQWFVRAAHAYVAAVTAPGVDGQLYPVDMRLRPSGNKGPVAVSLSSFRTYHAQSAWTWERMALTRARIVAGPPVMRAKVETAIAEALRQVRDPVQVFRDAAAMRGRMARDLPPEGPWDVKLRAGGMVDVEFIAQALQLVHGRAHPELFNPTTRLALRNLRSAGILPDADVGVLLRADHAWRTVQGMLRLVARRNAAPDLPEMSARPLLRAAAAAGLEAVDLPSLRATLDALAQEVRTLFVRHVGDPQA